MSTHFLMIDLVIPAYNEEKRIAPTLDAYLRDTTARLIVVLNGCTDDTASVVQRFVDRSPDRVSIINEPRAIGKGGALLLGWQHATSPVVSFVDADGSTSPKEFLKLINTLEHSPTADGVIASRFASGARILNRQSHMRSLMSRLFVIAARRILHLPFSDTQCGAKLFRRDALTGMLNDLTQTDMTIDVELLALLYYNGHTIIEVPTVWIDQPGSVALGTQSRFLHTGLHMVRSLFAIKRRIPKNPQKH